MIELSVIIPTYNRIERLRACLEALSRQTHSAADIEVMVIDDGSSDGTGERLAKLTTPFKLRVLRQEHSGQHIARNRGAEIARGRYCLFLDDDIVAGPRLIAEHLGALHRHERVVVIGQITMTVPGNADWFARCFAQRWSGHYARLNRGARPPRWVDCYGGNMSVSRALFLDVGGFAVDLPRSHDIELGYRLWRNGLSFIYASGAVGNQHEQKTFMELAQDANKAGAAWVKLYELHPPVLPELLGTLNEESRFHVLLQRTLLALDVPPRVLMWVGRIVANHPRIYSWYRFVHSYCYWRGVRQAITDGDTWRCLTQRIPILMYHAFGGPGERASRYIVPTRRFAWQMAWLKWCGYCVLRLEEFLRYRQEYRLPPPRSIVITIDDGYADSGSLAYPILRRYGFPATIFLVTNKVGSRNDWARNRELSGRSLLSWSDIERLRRNGTDFGAHTRTHPGLTSVSSKQAQEEIAGSRVDLETKLKTPINLFAYPYGEYDAATQAMVEQSGFQVGCTIRKGFNTIRTPLHALLRIEVEGTDSLHRFALKLWFGDSRAFRRLAGPWMSSLSRSRTAEHIDS